MPLRIHQEGKKILLYSITILALVNLLVYSLAPGFIWWSVIATFIIFLLVLQFFRNPIRNIRFSDEQTVYAPADGKVVVIEETYEGEYFSDRRRQVSIFMSPINVHVNRNPISGIVSYFRHHPGKYLVAWHPKSSTENERTTVVINNGSTEILLRQIAGALAKRIVNYLSEGQTVVQGDDMGFIKFGSRVDLFLPLDAEIMVEIGQKVKGNDTVIAKLPEK